MKQQCRHSEIHPKKIQSKNYRGNGIHN